ncbi:MAG: hypothetical protein AAGF12_08000 [Myxococcota bacterium]
MASVRPLGLLVVAALGVTSSAGAQPPEDAAPEHAAPEDAAPEDAAPEHVALGAPTEAQAEAATTAPENDVEQCIALTDRGTQTAVAELWEESRDALTAALEACPPRPSLYFNLAVVEAELGDLLVAKTHFEAYLQAPGDGDVSRLVDAAERAHGRIVARLGRLTLSIRGLHEADVIRLDDEALAHRFDDPILLNPGNHRLTITRPDRADFREAFSLAEGEALRMAIELTAETARLSEPLHVEENTTVFESPWFWLTVSLAVIAAAVVPVVLVTQAPSDGVTGNVGTIDLR